MVKSPERARPTGPAATGRPVPGRSSCLVLLHRESPAPGLEHAPMAPAHPGCNLISVGLEGSCYFPIGPAPHHDEPDGAPHACREPSHPRKQGTSHGPGSLTGLEEPAHRPKASSHGDASFRPWRRLIPWWRKTLRIASLGARWARRERGASADMRLPSAKVSVVAIRLYSENARSSIAVPEAGRTMESVPKATVGTLARARPWGRSTRAPGAVRRRVAHLPTKC